MTLIADATGRFNITVHSIDSFHLHASGGTCRASVSEGTAAAERLHCRRRISHGGQRLHRGGCREPRHRTRSRTLAPHDGTVSTTACISRSSVTLPVEGAGERVLKATLADANHCLFDASDSTTVLIAGDAPMEDGSMNMTVTPMTNDNVGTVSSGSANVAMSGTPDPTHSLSMDGTPMAHMSGTLEATPTPHDMSATGDTPSRQASRSASSRLWK